MSLLRAREAAKYLNISLATLYRIERKGELTPFRTTGGHRRYSLAMLNEYLEESRQRSLPVRPSTERVKSTSQDRLPDSVLRILVVGDEADTVELIIRALQEDRDVYELASASTYYEVGVQVMAFKPDLIIMSAAGLELEGPEVCQKIKGYPETRHIEVVAVVEPGANETIEELLRCGADDCLIKPLQIEEIQRSVLYLTSRKAGVEGERRTQNQTAAHK